MVRRKGNLISMAGRSESNRHPEKARTLGPVADLERHLPSDWWRTLFNAIYVQTDGDVVENAANTSADVDLLLAATNLKPGDKVLDLCCGQGRHCLELARRGFRNLAGLDRSRYLVQLARRRARAAGVPIDFHEGDARSLHATDGPFDCITILGNSFGYFDRQSDDIAVLAAVRGSMRPGGVLAMDISDGDWVRKNFERRSWEWIDQQHFVCRERTLSADGARLVCREVVTHAERGVIVDQFYAERLYSQAQLHSILREAGFDRLRDHGEIQSKSDRNQDLGMMAHRLFVTAREPSRKASQPTKAIASPLYPEVTVLLGDPTTADPIKRNGKFQPEDLATIDSLKSALSGLKGYRFLYHNKHSDLINDLRQHAPAFVLNFCDEGFRNDPTLELHIPALLEMLGIPYSGAGPSCLGLCYNKSLVNAAAAAMDIPVPSETHFGAGDLAATIPSEFPALIKPACGDGSIGITAASIVHNSSELVATIERLRDELPGRALLVQEYLTGPEYTVGVIGNPSNDLQVLPIIEPDYSRLDSSLPRILGYESKWRPESPYWNDISFREATLADDQRRRLRDYCTRLFERLDCRDYARFDFRADAEGTIKLLEVNPNPGWCWDGKLAKMAGLAGWSYSELLRRLIEIAQERLRISAPPSKPKKKTKRMKH